MNLEKKIIEIIKFEYKSTRMRSIEIEYYCERTKNELLYCEDNTRVFAIEPGAFYQCALIQSVLH